MVQLKYFYFATYAFIFLIQGCTVTTVGPLIIYFSKVTQQDETYFSFIFLARSLGSLFGGLAMKQLSEKLSYHKLLASLISICAISLIISSTNFGFYNLTITMFIAGAACCMMTILVNLCLFQLFYGPEQNFWIQTINLFFGIGGLIGPILVVFFEQFAMRALGFAAFLALISFGFLKSPETHHNKQKNNHNKIYLPKNAQICICLLFFIYLAEVIGLTGWMPTYAFKAKVGNEQQSSSLASIFWIVNTGARFILLYLRGSVADRLHILLKYLVFGTFIVLVLQWAGRIDIVCYFGAIITGFFLSAMYALFFSIAQQYGYSLTASNTANFALCAQLGQGFLVMPIGYAMGLFGYKALIYIIFIFSLALFGIFTYGINIMKNDSKNQKEELQTPLKNLSTSCTLDL